MSDLDGQRAKRTGSRDRIDRIKDEMDRKVLRDRIIRALLSIRCDLEEPCEDCRILACQDADAVIRELKLEAEDGECGYCHAQLPGCRYSTWKADDE
jgi:hypothetical protein